MHSVFAGTQFFEQCLNVNKKEENSFMRRTFRVAKITEGGAHRYGIFSSDGNTFIGEADMDSLRHCAEELMSKRGDHRIKRNPDGEVVEAALKATEGLKGRLGDLVAARMTERRCDYVTALKEVCAETPELWREHQNRHSILFAE